MARSKKNKSIGEVVSEIRMLRVGKGSSTFLVVESQPDSAFWAVRTCASCDIVDATCKSVGVGAVRRLNGTAQTGHVGVFDRDYDDAMTTSNWRANILFWDAHSIETVLFETSAFDRILPELISADDLAALESRLGSTLREYVARTATAIGAIRWLLYLSGITDDDDHMSPYRIAESTGSVPQPESALEAGVRAGAAPTVQQLRKKLLHPDINIPPRSLMRGHDISALTSLALERVGRVSCSGKKIEQLLRVALTQADFLEFSLVRELREWEANTTNSQIF